MGFRKGDIIIGFNRRKINNLEELARRFKRYRANSIQVRRDGDIRSLRLH